MIGEHVEIHLLYFSSFRNIVPTLADPINLSREHATQKILENILVL